MQNKFGKMLMALLLLAILAFITFRAMEHPRQSLPVKKTPPAANAISLPEGWQGTLSRGGNFIVALPAGWEQIDHNPESLEAEMRRWKAISPQLAALLEDVLANGGELIWGAFRATLAGPSRANVAMVSMPLPADTSAADFIDGNARELKRVVVDGQVSRRRVSLAGKEGAELRYRINLQGADGRKTVLAATQYITVAGQTAFALTCTTTAENDKVDYPVFNKIASTLRAR